jgi:hypothetical protein
MTTDLLAAVDIGGTKIAGAVLDADGTLLERVQLPTPAREPGEVVLAAVTEVVHRLAAGPRWPLVRAVGVGSAGPVDARAGTVSPVNIPGWRDFPLVDGVRKASGGLPVTLVGDGPAIAAGEHWRGAARGCANALCMVVSTGVGGGLVLDGALRAQELLTTVAHSMKDDWVPTRTAEQRVGYSASSQRMNLHGDPQRRTIVPERNRHDLRPSVDTGSQMNDSHPPVTLTKRRPDITMATVDQCFECPFDTEAIFNDGDMR